MRRLAPIVLLLPALALLSACESTFDQAARARAEGGKAAKAVKAKVTQVAGVTADVEGILVSDDKSTAAVVVHVKATKPDVALLWAPIQVNLKDASGKVIATNNTPGADPGLIHLASLPKGGETWYVNDQIILDKGGTPVSADVIIGGEPAKVDVPDPLSITKPVVAKGDFGMSWTTTVTNDSDAQQETVMLGAVFRKGGKVVGAGTAQLHGMKPGGAQDAMGFVVGRPDGDITVIAAPGNGPGGAGAPKAG